MNFPKNTNRLSPPLLLLRQRHDLLFRRIRIRNPPQNRALCRRHKCLCGSGSHAQVVEYKAGQNLGLGKVNKHQAQLFYHVVLLVRPMARLGKSIKAACFSILDSWILSEGRRFENLEVRGLRRGRHEGDGGCPILSPKIACVSDPAKSRRRWRASATHDVGRAAGDK